MMDFVLPTRRTEELKPQNVFYRLYLSIHLEIRNRAAGEQTARCLRPLCRVQFMHREAAGTRRRHLWCFFVYGWHLLK